MSDYESPANSYRRKMAWRRTPEENMGRFCELQEQAFALLEASPKAMDHFLRRNYRKRRQSKHFKESWKIRWDISAMTAKPLERTVPVDLSYVKSKHLMMLGTDLGYLDVFDYIPGVDEPARR